MPITALALNCSLKPSGGKPSSTDAMIKVIADEFAKHDMTVSETIRLADHDVKPGVESDMGEGDAWPGIRAKILAADILIFGTPIWMGQTCSVAKRALERMDAFLGETDEQGRMPSFGKLAVAAIVGNEDGAHHVTADLFQSLNDTGWTIPAAASCYWVGEAMHKIDFNTLPETPKEVQQTAAMLASNAAHLAKLLKGEVYPGVKQEQ